MKAQGDMKKSSRQNAITPVLFDEHVSKKSETAPRPIAEVIWGAKAIGQAIGRSADFVRDTLAAEPGSPVRRKGREYYARRDELDQFFR